MEKVIYYSKLDTLRFWAFFLVFWHHGFSPSFTNLTSNPTLQAIIRKLTVTGGIGVHIFFVLSGFLITHLMLSEERLSGGFKLKNFYVRRILRIWPLYYIIMTLGIFILPNLFNTFEFNGSVIKNLIFLNNFDLEQHSPNVAIAWSVAIEEQFYLFWPLLFLWLKNKTTLIIACTCLFVASAIFIFNNPDESYFHSFGNVLYLMTGCIGAILFSKFKDKYDQLFISKPKTITFLILSTILIITLPVFNNIFNPISLLALPICYLVIILNLVHNNNSKTNVFSRLGKYTYGMYVYHPMIIIFVKMTFDFLEADYQTNPIINLIFASIAFGITIFLSIFSYNYIERHILKLKSKFAFVKTRI